MNKENDCFLVRTWGERGLVDTHECSFAPHVSYDSPYRIQTHMLGGRYIVSTALRQLVPDDTHALIKLATCLLMQFYSIEIHPTCD